MRISKTALSGGLIIALAACYATLSGGVMLFLGGCDKAHEGSDGIPAKVGISSYAGGYAVKPADQLIGAAAEAVQR